jgi:hypothetical protein
MNAQMPFPSFEDARKLLNFWLDQQDRWFYFEGEKFPSASEGNVTHSPPIFAGEPSPWDNSLETTYYVQTRIVGKIRDIVNFPPSLLLDDTSVFTVLMSLNDRKTKLVEHVKRNKYGLVFSQITYYEPIQDPAFFLRDDPRVKYKTDEENIR